MKNNITNFISIALLGSLIGSGSKYVLNAVIAQFGGADTLGLFSLGTVIIGVGGLIGRAGLDNAVLKFVPSIDVNESRSEPLLAVIFSFILGVSTVAMFYLIYPEISSMYGYPNSWEIYIFAVGVPFQAVTWVLIKSTQVSNNTQYTVYIRDLGQATSALLFISILLFVLPSDLAVALGFVCSFLVSILTGVVLNQRLGLISWNLSISDFSLVKNMLIYSVPVMIASASQYLVSWTDVLVLSGLTTSQNVGFYQAAFQTSAVLSLVLNATNSIFPSLASEYHTQNKIKELKALTSSVTKWISYFTVIGFILIVYKSEFILSSIFGAEFSIASTSLILLSAGNLAAALTGPVGYVLIMSGYERIDLSNNIIIVIVNLLLNIYLIPRSGILGAAIATSSSILLLNVVRLLQVWYTMGIYPQIRNYSRIVFFMLLSFFLLFFLDNLFLDIISIFIYLFSALLMPISYIRFFGIPKRDEILFDAM